jgi:hypothetical protein
MVRFQQHLFICAIAGLAACGARGSADTRPQGQAGAASAPSASPRPSGDHSAAGSGAAGAALGPPAAGHGDPASPLHDTGRCSTDGPLRDVGCSCTTPGATVACWSGPAAQRNLRDCHDGVQTCNANDEFPSWGPCVGEQLDCGAPPVTDAGSPPPSPPPPPPDDRCGCIPGVVVQCDEDCSVSLFCTLTASKTCQPDGTWGPCRETSGLNLGGLLGGDAGLGQVVSAGVSVACDALTTDPLALVTAGACRNVYHGCCSSRPEGIFSGDCGSLYTCGHVPDQD